MIVEWWYPCCLSNSWICGHCKFPSKLNVWKLWWKTNWKECIAYLNQLMLLYSHTCRMYLLDCQSPYVSSNYWSVWVDADEFLFVRIVRVAFLLLAAMRLQILVAADHADLNQRFQRLRKRYNQIKIASNKIGQGKLHTVIWVDWNAASQHLFTFTRRTGRTCCR